MYELIAVPLDDSSLDDQAIAWATLIARQCNCRIEFIRVLVAPPVWPQAMSVATPVNSPELERSREKVERALEQQAFELGRANALRISAVAVSGDMPGTLESRIEERNADLVVMSPHDRSRIERMLMGSVSDAVVRHMHRPVLLVNEAAPANVRHILVPLDGSGFSEQILPHVQVLAQLMHARVTLLTVIASLPLPQPPAAELPVTEETVATDQEFRLDATAEPLRLAGLAVETRAMIDQNVAEAIEAFAQQQGADILALATHGRGGLGRILAGSVAHKLAHGNMPAVLLYRPIESEENSG